ncbi:hypothetical protein KGD82_13535 [Nocardiopsis eucommiae]|uniref:Helix-turn-helix domain-containing protein n=1 Tax=Nocardiopsis eucommiae TaxID=2831970 RepID=A0A975QKS9_9ACTN|nr:hypothetical protein KGD82_13535 [Nocardiopsis eucommiae]
MARGQRITPEQWQAIAQAIRDGGTCRGIATEHDVSPDSVRRIAKEENIPDAFARAHTEKATRARVADMAERRARIAEKYLSKAEQLLDQMDEPHLVYSFGGKENTYAEHLLDRAPTGDLRNLMTTSAVAVDKHMKLIAADTDTGAATAASMLSGIADALQIAAEQLDDEDPAAGEG